MGEERRTHPANGNGTCLCVALTGHGTPRPEELLHGLEKRGAAVRVVSEPTGVMVELASGARAVIVNEPTRMPRLPRLLAAVRRYYPQAVCWQFTQDSEPQLSRIGRNGSSSPSPLPGVGEGGSRSEPGEGGYLSLKEAPKSGPSPNWKITPHPSPLPQGERGLEQGISGDPPMISAEELAMLLAPMPERAQHEGEMEDEE